MQGRPNNKKDQISESKFAPPTHLINEHNIFHIFKT